MKKITLSYKICSESARYYSISLQGHMNDTLCQHRYIDSAYNWTNTNKKQLHILSKGMLKCLNPLKTSKERKKW